MNSIGVIFVDDHQILLDGLQLLLAQATDIHIIKTYTSAQQAFQELAETQPDVVITDINMPAMDGMEFCKNIKSSFPDIKIIALSMFGDKFHISQMMSNGASAYLLKNSTNRDLQAAIYKVNIGKTYLSEEVQESYMDFLNYGKNHKESQTLTQREVEIIKLLSKDKNNAQIADELCISERTVETHRKNIMRKAEVNTVVGLLKYAMDNGLV